MAIHRGIATMTLDTGHCPPWLFQRMVKLGREMIREIVAEVGPEEFVRRMGDPAWFQTLGTVLAFDWNASGLTTILTAALKEAIRGEERELGIFICGGKGKTSLRTPDEINAWSDRLALPDAAANALVYNSKMSAKVDSSLVQDGYQLYHHAFFFTRSGAWTVVQQGMNETTATARRYHWHSKQPKDLINEPHSGIAAQARARCALNMTAGESAKSRAMSTELVGQNYATLMRDITLLRRYSTPVSKMARLKTPEGQLSLLELAPVEFKYHPVLHEDFRKSKYLEKILWKLCDEHPESYEKLLATPGVGPKTIRALALVAEVIYGARPSYEDPARYSFAHGGKDATPFPIDRRTYDKTIDIMRRVRERTRRIGDTTKTVPAAEMV
jgi:hypothetical protein